MAKTKQISLSLSLSLQILPLLSLHLYFSRSLCRNVKLCVQGQIQKVLTLTNLHLYSDAIKTLQQLLHGERLPQIGSPYFRPAEVKMEVLEFDSSLCFHELVNLKVSWKPKSKYLLGCIERLQVHLFIERIHCKIILEFLIIKKKKRNNYYYCWYKL